MVKVTIGYTSDWPQHVNMLTFVRGTPLDPSTLAGESHGKGRISIGFEGKSGFVCGDSEPPAEPCIK